MPGPEWDFIEMTEELARQYLVNAVTAWILPQLIVQVHNESPVLHLLDEEEDNETGTES